LKFSVLFDSPNTHWDLWVILCCLIHQFLLRHTCHWWFHHHNWSSLTLEYIALLQNLFKRQRPYNGLTALGNIFQLLSQSGTQCLLWNWSHICHFSEMTSICYSLHRRISFDIAGSAFSKSFSFCWLDPVQLCSPGSMRFLLTVKCAKFHWFVVVLIPGVTRRPVGKGTFTFLGLVAIIWISFGLCAMVLL
jgi:hypothetical protein